MNNPLLDGRDVVDDDLGGVVHLLRVALPCPVNNHLTLQDKMILHGESKLRMPSQVVNISLLMLVAIIFCLPDS